ncbi:alpha/beta fold hydrolase [Streptomyces deccanensis]|uniref:alpha/beta fold hydrolase n=1 Tax=Streptomyces deccanensis TaxID=424188 RepID=UPI001EFAC99A|nr:alpha/beta hydrolase [Streptomyces deccanensis]ULR55825.1 alpha/beta hydrolase [Streptomyces deccanensis]
MADLAADHTALAPDLRGYGLSDKPTTGYDKRRMAVGIAGLVDALGFEKAAVGGHDRGARVGHRWALDRPEQVERLAVLDIVPTREMVRRLDASLASGYWHRLFHMQPDLLERLVGRDTRGSTVTSARSPVRVPCARAWTTTAPWRRTPLSTTSTPPKTAA